MRRWLAVLLSGLLIACGGIASERESPMSVNALRDGDFDAELVFERDLDDGESFTAYLVSYRHAGLKLHAMVAVPAADVPEGGFPVVVANHGYVPDPRRYGITSEGIDSRPGDYYRSVPELYASRGFMVVIPDYRGHNSSEGYEFTQLQVDRAIEYYAEDVVALMSALDDLEDADMDRVFMWSHSMGGPVSLRALLATDIVKAASFWSTMSMEDIEIPFRELDGPVIVQHSNDDPTTSIENSIELMRMVSRSGRESQLFRLNGDEHLFSGMRLEIAADRDAEFFRAQVAGED